MIQRTKAMHPFFIPCLLIAFAAVSFTARAASVKITDANGNVFEFTGDGIPCCDDWGLASGSSCEDDCVIASNGTGSSNPFVNMLMRAFRAESKGLLVDAEEKANTNQLIENDLKAHGTSVEEAGFNLDTTSLYVEGPDERLLPLDTTKAAPQAVKACHHWLIFFVSCTEAVEGLTLAECDAQLDDLGLDDWWCEEASYNPGGGGPNPPQPIEMEMEKTR